MTDSSEALLRCAGGQPVNMTEALEALKAVVEPLKRQLCGLLGLFATPELASPAAGDAMGSGELGWVGLGCRWGKCLSASPISLGKNQSAVQNARNHIGAAIWANLHFSRL